MKRRNEVGVMGKAGLEQLQEASWRRGLQASSRRHVGSGVLGLESTGRPRGQRRGVSLMFRPGRCWGAS